MRKRKKGEQEERRIYIGMISPSFRNKVSKGNSIDVSYADSDMTSRRRLFRSETSCFSSVAIIVLQRNLAARSQFQQIFPHSKRPFMHRGPPTCSLPAPVSRPSSLTAAFETDALSPSIFRSSNRFVGATCYSPSSFLPTFDSFLLIMSIVSDSRKRVQAKRIQR